jgi:hypothetical protein
MVAWNALAIFVLIFFLGGLLTGRTFEVHSIPAGVVPWQELVKGL